MIFKSKINFLIIIYVIIILTGCSNTSQYNSDVKEFKSIYSETIENLETTDAFKTIEQLQTDKNKKNIEELQKLLELIKKDIPKEKEMLYDVLKNQYDDLVFLKDSYNSFNNLSLDEKRRMGIVLVNIAMNKDN